MCRQRRLWQPLAFVTLGLVLCWCLLYGSSWYGKVSVIPVVQSSTDKTFGRFSPQVPGSKPTGPVVEGLHFLPVENITVTLNMTPWEAENNFYRFVTRKHVECDLSARFGHLKDGGWDMCVIPPYEPRLPCTVYSFGINNDWSFDDAISTHYNCIVRAFDPSMKALDHRHSKLVWFYRTGIGGKNIVNSKGWKIKTLGNLLTSLGNNQTYIDYLKMDVEYNEWDSLESMIRDGTLRHVKQFGFEIHTHEVMRGRNAKHTQVWEFVRYYRILLSLERHGFRRWLWHYNPSGGYISRRTGQRRTCCYELVYINVNFLTSKDPRPRLLQYVKTIALSLPDLHTTGADYRQVEERLQRLNQKLHFKVWANTFHPNEELNTKC